MDLGTLALRVRAFFLTHSISHITRDIDNWSRKGHVCYDGFGCFTNDDKNLCKYMSVLPYPPDEMTPGFHIYTSEVGNGISAQYIDYSDMTNTTQLQINSSQPMFVVVHGFSQFYPFEKFLRPLKDALIEQGNNVMLIHWIKGADFPNYRQSVSNTRVIGAMIANVLLHLDQQRISYLGETTVVGYSLGAHVAGFVGKALTAKQSQIRSIVGLDPSLEFFGNAPPQCRLAAGDAKFVQIFHSSGSTPGDKDKAYADITPSGDADFYFNGGRYQRLCVGTHDVKKCSHDLSFVYYTETARDAKADHGCKFKAFPCNEEDWAAGKCFQCFSNFTKGGCPTPGYEAGMDARGIFFLDTLTENKTHGRYCGWRYVVSLSSEMEAVGEIAIVQRDSTGKGYAVIFSGENDVLQPSETKTRVVVFPHPITEPGADLFLTFRKSSSTLTKDSDSLTVKEMLLSEMMGTGTITKSILRNQVIKDGEAVPLKLL